MFSTIDVTFLILFPYSHNSNAVLIPREGGSPGPWTSRSTTRADRGYISRLGKRGGPSRLGDSTTYNINNRDYLGPEEKVPWIRLRKRGGTGGDAVPWVRLKKADFLEEGEKVWYV